MWKYKSHVTVVEQLLLLSIICLVVSSSFAKKDGNIEPAIQAIVSKTGKTIADFIIVGNNKLNLKYLFEQVTEYRILDKTTNHITNITLDSNNKPVDRYAKLTKNRQEKRAKFGSLSPALSDKVSRMKDQDKSIVSIWVEGFDHEPFLSVNDKGLVLDKKAYVTWDKKRKTALADYLIPIRKLFSAAGITDVQFSASVPVIGAKLSKEQVIAISKFHGISVFEDIKLSPQSMGQILTMKMGNYQYDFPFEGPYDDGYSGQNVTIALVEFENIQYDTHISQNGQAIFNGYNRSSTEPSCNPDFVGNHVTQVASVATGYPVVGYAAIQGIAYNAKVLGAHGCTNDLSGSIGFSNSIDWARLPPQNADVINSSVGGSVELGPLDANTRVFDSFVRNYRLNIVVSAANCGIVKQYVGTPGVAYNVITVGMESHVQTYGLTGTDFWSDDQMLVSSCWKNPVSLHGDREKPDVVASGGFTDVWDGSGYPNTTVVAGTSFSAPAVTGVVALAIEANSSLRNSPELTKAIIAATAWQNIEGPPEATTDASSDDKDGAGSVVGARVNTVAKNSNRYVQGTINTTANGNITPPISIVAPTIGHLIRVALSWSVDVNYANYDNEPSADLDIRVVKPDGTYMPYQYTWDSNLEVLEFAAPTAGIYTFEILQYRVDSFTFYGIAVDSMDPAAIPSPRSL